MIVQETFEINGRQFVRTYSDSGRYVVGGNPEGAYDEATDPVELGRTYIEGDLIPGEEREATAQELLDIILGGAE